MKYKINMDDGKEFLLQADRKLSEVKVDGNSVESLYLARMLLAKVINSLEEVKDEKEKGDVKNE